MEKKKAMGKSLLIIFQITIKKIMFWGKRTIFYFERPNFTGQHLIISLFCSLFLFGLLYRVVLSLHLMMGTAFPSFQSERYSFLFLLRYLWTELTFALFFTATMWLLYSWFRPLKGLIKKVLFIFSFLILNVILIFLPLIYAIHQKTMFTLNSGLTFEILAETLSAFVFRDALHLASFGELFLLFLPLIFFWLLLMLPRSVWWWRNLIALVMMVLVLLLHISQPFNSRPPLDRSISTDPVVFILQELVYNYQKSHHKKLNARKIVRNKDKILKKNSESIKLSMTDKVSACKKCQKLCSSKGQKTQKLSNPHKMKKTNNFDEHRHNHLKLSSLKNFGGQNKSFNPSCVRLIGSSFLKSAIPTKKVIHGATKWNIVVFVLESSGMRYISRKTPDGQKDIMPFFKKFIKKGWLFKKHFSPANTSPRSVFSIFSGLYPLPRIWMLSTKRDIYIPSLKSFLPKNYETFLVTPAPLRWYFPRWFFFNSGLKEMYGYYSIPIKKRNVGWIVARNEIDVTSFFINRIKKAKEPFWGTYLSFIPHYPYSDYGKKYRIVPHNRGGLYRYYNNLHLLDQQLKRVVTSLKESGKLKRTILVFVGDHGEAFGQHKGNYTHSRRSYNENYHAPLFFYQPKIFSPRVSYKYTSHVDILPTLLDALKIPYNRKLLQGESLFQRSFQRKQIFLFGNENTLSSIDENNIKTQISFRFRWCWSYDLEKDPSERKRHGCQDVQQQKKTLLYYHQLQFKILQQYNKACMKKQLFHHLKHPTISL